MRRRLCYATAVALAVASIPVEGAVRLRSSVDAQRIGLEDQLQLTVTVDGSTSGDLAVPTLENLEVVGGPSVSTQISLVGGQMSQSRSYTWVLRARSVGKAKVGEVKLGSETAPAIAIEVEGGSVRPRPRPRPMDPFGDPFEDLLGRRQAQRADPRLFVEATLSRAKLRVGESARLSYWIYTQVPVSEFAFVEPPQYPGVWLEDLKREDAPRTEPTVRDGDQFQRAIIVDKLVFPTKAGKLVLPPARFRISVPSQGFFDAGATVVRATKAISLDVEPLPEAPGFSGAVGRFTARATLDRTELPLGEAATLRFRVEGTGNLKWIEKPPEVVVAGARVFPPQAKSDLKAGEAGITGSRTWEFVVVPETAGRIEIPSLQFVYFDPAASRIVRVDTAPLGLEVQGGTGSVATLAPVVGAPNGTRGSALLPLRNSLDLRRAWVPLIGPRGLLALIVMLLAGQMAFLAAPLVGRLTGARKAVHRGGSRSVSRDLTRVARGGLGREEAILLLEKALHQAFGDLPDDPRHDKDRDRAARALLDEVRFVRYAPQLGDYSEAIRGIAERAAEAVRRWA